RHCAALVQLAVVAPCRRLCRGAARHPAAAATSVLVRADAGAAAGARRLEADQRRVLVQPRAGGAVGCTRSRPILGNRRGRAWTDPVLCPASPPDSPADP